MHSANNFPLITSREHQHGIQKESCTAQCTCRWPVCLFSSMSTPSELPSDNKEEKITRTQVIRSHQCTRPRMCEGGSLRSRCLQSGWRQTFSVSEVVSTESSVRLSADEEDNSESSSFSHVSGGGAVLQMVLQMLSCKCCLHQRHASWNKLMVIHHLLYVMVWSSKVGSTTLICKSPKDRVGLVRNGLNNPRSLITHPI